MSGPLTGLRVLDLSRVLAGPYCAMLLGDMGADVVKVEPPGGDDTRQWGPPFAEGESAYYLSCNRNKRSLVLDLRAEAGQEVLQRLAATADVLIENFKGGTMERWGLGYEAVLRPRNPRLVYCSISGFGRTGPYAHLPGYDFVIQAMGGLMAITGQPDGEPLKVGVAISDLTTGMMASFGITAALLWRDRTGEGQRVDLSLLETQVGWLANVASSYLLSGQVPNRPGNAHANIVPYQALHARDGQLVVAVGNDQQFARLCRLLDLAELPHDPRFITNKDRVAHREVLVALLEGALARRDVAAWIRLMWEQGIPAGPINRLDQVFADPQVLHREMLQQVEHPTIGWLPQVGIPIKHGSTPGAIRRPPPLMGEHTRELLAELGYEAAAIDRLLAAGVVRAGPNDEREVPQKG